MIKLIAIDLDETLLKQDKTYDRERFKQVIPQLEAQDILVTIMTGNVYHKIPDYFDPELMRELYFGADNGNYLVKGGELIHDCSIPRSIYVAIGEFLEQFPQYRPVVVADNVSYLRVQDHEANPMIAVYNPDLTLIEGFEDVPEDAIITKMAINSEEPLSYNKNLARTLMNLFPEIAAVTSGNGWVDVYNRDGGKGSGVNYLQKKYGIERSQSMAIGDSLNDESMLDQVEYSVAMGNADHDLTWSAQYQIGTNQDGAVLDLLEQIAADPSMAFMEEYRIHAKREK